MADRPESAESDADSADVVNGEQSDLIAPGGKVDQQALFELYEKSEAASGDDESPITVRFQLLRDLDKRLDKYLVDRIPFLSRTSLQELIKENAVTVNGRPAKASTRLHKRDVVVAVLPPPPSTEIAAENIPLDVLYEDQHIIVINKKADIIVHPARGNKSGTIINALAWHFQHNSSGALSTVGEQFARPGVVHRLDRHTTGVMVAAKCDTAHWRLGKQFEHRQTEKRYLAVVHGQMEPLADIIDLPMGKHSTIREKYAVRWDETGKPSVTIYRVREIYKDFTLVELELKTGRTHQIRVHMSHIGFPIVGDDIYGGKHLRIGDVVPPQSRSMAAPRLPSTTVLDPAAPLITRYALHAAMLGFTHPITNERMTLHAPVHDDMRLLVQLLRQYRFVAAPNVAGSTLNLDTMINS
jgi:23S rRNA pseudouridine1911/1915/1917 synthase